MPNFVDLNATLAAFTEERRALELRLHALNKAVDALELLKNTQRADIVSLRHSVEGPAPVGQHAAENLSSRMAAAMKDRKRRAGDLLKRLGADFPEVTEADIARHLEESPRFRRVENGWFELAPVRHGIPAAQEVAG